MSSPNSKRKLPRSLVASGPRRCEGAGAGHQPCCFASSFVVIFRPLYFSHRKETRPLVVSIFALAFRTLARMCRSNRELPLPTGVFWAAYIVTAVLFGLGHLPAT